MRKSTSSFSSGEVSDLADDRSAIDVVAKGLKTLTNAELGRYGHLDKRGGTDNLGTLKAGTDWRLVSFEFSSFTQFQLEFGSGYVRFWSNDAQVEVTPGGAWLTATAYALGDAVTQSGTTYYCMEAHTSGTFATDLAAEKWYALEGNILEVPSPYTGSQIHEFQHQSIQDFIYLAHPSHPRKVLKRYADDHWQMEDPGFLGPYAEVDDEIEFTASAATGNIDLTSDTDFFEADHVGAKFRLFYRQPAATETGSIEEVWNAAASAGLSSTNHTAGDTIYVTPSSDRIFYTCIADYAFSTDHTGSNDPADYPTFFEAGAAMIGPTYMAGRWDFTTEGTWRGEFQIKTSEDGVEYNTVATHFTDDNESNFTSGDDAPTPIWIKVDVMFTDVAHSEVHNLRIGQFDVPGVVVLTGVSDAQTATATVTTDLYSSGIAEKWEIESFNEVDGYARAIGFEDNRLTFAGSTRYPIDKWYSETNNYTNFVAGTAQDQPFSISAIGFDSSPAQWLSSHDGAFMGTASAEATLTPQNIEQSVGPENLPVVRWFSNEGCAYLPPVFLNSRLFALQSSTERLSEYAYSIERGFNGGYDPSEATLLAEHMLAGGVRQLAIRRMPEKGIWCVLNNGTVAVFTHRPKAQLAGWWRIATNGAIKSVAIARGNGTEDSVYMAVLRGGVGYMEKMRQGNLTRRRNAEAAALADDTATVGANVSLLGYLDCASTHTGSGLTSISGLTRFAGAEVTYLADGMARTGEVSGAGVLTLESPSDVVQVGLPFDTIIEPRSIEAFSEFSTSVSRYKVAKTCILSIYLSAGGMVRDNSGSEWSLTPDQLAADNPLGGKLHKLATGQFRVDITGDAQRKKSIRITHSDPYPFTLLGLYTELEEHPL